MKLYVGNLSFNLSDNDLRTKFEEFGAVESANIITDRDTGRSKGFGFVEMQDAAQGTEAIAQLNGAEFEGRKVIVNEARPRPERTGGDRGGDRGGSRGPRTGGNGGGGRW